MRKGQGGMNHSVGQKTKCGTCRLLGSPKLPRVLWSLFAHYLRGRRKQSQMPGWSWWPEWHLGGGQRLGWGCNCDSLRVYDDVADEAKTRSRKKWEPFSISFLTFTDSTLALCMQWAYDNYSVKQWKWDVCFFFLTLKCLFFAALLQQSKQVCVLQQNKALI